MNLSEGSFKEDVCESSEGSNKLTAEATPNHKFLDKTKASEKLLRLSFQD